MPPTPSALTTVEILALAALADRDRYGYQLVERIDALSGGRVSVRPGNLYRVLHRLTERGLVGEARAPSPVEDPRRQYFRATAAGRRLLADQLGMYADLLAAPELLRALGDA